MAHETASRLTPLAQSESEANVALTQRVGCSSMRVRRLTGQTERVLDLRPWTEMNAEAMAETIRIVLTEAGIKTLVWDHPPSNPIRGSTPAASRATWRQRERKWLGIPIS